MMGESACLMHAFSYASGTPNEAKEGNPIHALGESISFGRFMSESLSWEKWSSFSHNRYVEEAEKYSKPGSVAQKKAFFEAHYKRIAAQKAAAAALLEQPDNNNPEPEAEDRVVISVSTQNSNSQTTYLKSQDNVDAQQDVSPPNKSAGLDVDATGYISKIKDDKLEFCREKGDGHLAKVELSSQFGDVDNHNQVNELELSEKSVMEKPLLKEASESTNKKKPALRASKLPYSPAIPKAAIVNHPRKENSAPPISRDAAIDYSNKKRFTPKPVHLTMNSTPSREVKKLTIPDIGNIKSSKVVASYAKAYNCLTPLRTPATASVSKPYSGTPQSENRRTRTPLHPSASGSKTTGPKWRFLAMDFSKTLGACRNKSHSPVISSPFSLRTEERAARRKEKLEEKFNEKVVQKVQLQTKLKDKAESELKKLRQSLCFKARPLPEFYRERKPPKNQTRKSPLTQLQSPIPGRKPSPSTAQGTTSLPSQWPASNSKYAQPKKNSQSQIRSHTSLADMIMHENASPNIQF